MSRTLVHRRPFDFTVLPRRVQGRLLFCILYWSVLSYLFISHFVIEGTEVVGESMEPTLHDGQRNVLYRWVYHFREPRRGDIIVFRVPGLEGLSVKRVIGLPSDRVQVKDGYVYLNGERLREAYLASDLSTRSGRFATDATPVSEGSYFVLGDNRDNSLDSRDFGPVRRDWVTGVLQQ